MHFLIVTDRLNRKIDANDRQTQTKERFIETHTGRKKPPSYKDIDKETQVER